MDRQHFRHPNFGRPPSTPPRPARRPPLLTTTTLHRGFRPPILSTSKLPCLPKLTTKTVDQEPKDNFKTSHAAQPKSPNSRHLERHGLLKFTSSVRNARREPHPRTPQTCNLQRSGKISIVLLSSEIAGVMGASNLTTRNKETPLLFLFLFVFCFSPSIFCFSRASTRH
jgi:hypothetical protein